MKLTGRISVSHGLARVSWNPRCKRVGALSGGGGGPGALQPAAVAQLLVDSHDKIPSSCVRLALSRAAPFTQMLSLWAPRIRTACAHRVAAPLCCSLGSVMLEAAFSGIVLKETDNRVLWSICRTLSGLGSTQGPVPVSPTSSDPSRLYPETWLPMSSYQDFLQVPVAREDRSYRTVYSLFHKTVSETKFRILRILRVQNPFLWEKYKR